MSRLNWDKAGRSGQLVRAGLYDVGNGRGLSRDEQSLINRAARDAERRSHENADRGARKARPVQRKTPRGAVVDEAELARLVADFEQRKRAAAPAPRASRSDARTHLLAVADEQERRRRAARAIAALHNGQIATSAR